MLVSIVASPLCAMTTCDDEPVSMSDMEHHDCCPEPCGGTPTQQDPCGDHCTMHKDETPAEVPAVATHAPLVPLALVDVVAVESALVAPDTSEPDGDEALRHLAQSTPVHVLISQFLI